MALEGGGYSLNVASPTQSGTGPVGGGGFNTGSFGGSGSTVSGGLDLMTVALIVGGGIIVAILLTR